MSYGLLVVKVKNFGGDELAEGEFARKAFLDVVMAVVDFVAAFGVLMFTMPLRHFFFQVMQPVQ